MIRFASNNSNAGMVGTFLQLGKFEIVRGIIGVLALERTKSEFFSQLMKGSFWEWVGFSVCLIAVIGLIWLVVRIRTWLRDDAGSAADNCELLNQLHDLKQEDHLSEEEIRSINRRMSNLE